MKSGGLELILANARHYCTRSAEAPLVDSTDCRKAVNWGTIHLGNGWVFPMAARRKHPEDFRRQARRAWKRRVVWAGGMTGAILLALALGAIPSVVRASRDAKHVRAHLFAAEKSVRDGRLDDALAALQRAETRAHAAQAALAGPIQRVVGALPIVGRPLWTARLLMGSAAQASSTAADVLPVVQESRFWNAGTVDLDNLDRLGVAAERAGARFATALDSARRSPAWPLPGSLARERAEYVAKLQDVNSGLRKAALGAKLSAAVLGGREPRRYLLVGENPAEMRGAGGFWGSYGILVAEGGRLRLERVGRTQDELGMYAGRNGPAWFHERYASYGSLTEWQQLASAPDFPAVASVAEANLAQAKGLGPIDGTIAIDPVGLASLLRVAGPVDVPNWPEPLDHNNVVRAIVHDAEARFASDGVARVAFLTDTVRVVWSKFLGADVSVRGLGRSGIGDAAASKHIRLHFARPDEQRLARALGADGRLGDPATTIAVVTQNIAGNKIDQWLHRRVRGNVQLRSDGSATVELRVSLRNDGPASGMPRRVIGPYDERFRAGWNNQLVRVYLPGSASMVPQGSPKVLTREQGFVVVEQEVSVPPGETRSVSFVANVDDAWDPEAGHARLTLRRQAVLNPDETFFEVRPPRWCRIGRARGASLRDGRAVIEGDLDRDATLALEIGRTLLGRLLLR